MSISSSGNANLTGEDQSKGGGVATTQNQSLSVGYNAAPQSVGIMNSFLGYQVALYSRTGSYNVVVGGESALRLASSYNCVIGANTLVGCAADVGAGNVEDAVAIGSASSVGAKGGAAIGAGATAGGALSLAIGAGAQTASEGEINVMNRVCGYRAAQSNKYTLELNADLTRLGGALSFPGPSSWAVFGDVASKDLVFLSEDGVSTRLTGAFRPGVLNFTGQHRCRVAEGEDLLAFRPGAVVVATGAYCDLDGCKDLLDVDEALPVVTLCRRARDPRVFGVSAPEQPPPAAAASQSAHLAQEQPPPAAAASQSAHLAQEQPPPAAAASQSAHLAQEQPPPAAAASQSAHLAPEQPPPAAAASQLGGLGKVASASAFLI
eukprot:gene29902-17974_t